MKKFFLLAGIFALMISFSLNAQVTIGENKEPNSNAVLELTTPNNDKGFLPPRVALENPHNPKPLSAHVQGMIVYNTNGINSPDSLTEGLYVNNGTRWIALRQAPFVTPAWFYMPSFPLDVSKPDKFTVNLWEKYKHMFEGPATQGGLVRILNEPNLQPILVSPNQLGYYVAGYDNSVFSEVELSPDGILQYKITDENFKNVSDSTYMNIILLIK
jgi:hypothetical protein